MGVHGKDMVVRIEEIGHVLQIPNWFLRAEKGGIDSPFKGVFPKLPQPHRFAQIYGKHAASRGTPAAPAATGIAKDPGSSREISASRGEPPSLPVNRRTKDR